MESEVLKAAYKLTHEILGIKPKETVLFYDETVSDATVRQAVAATVHSMGATAVTMTYSAAAAVATEPPRPVEAAMLRADVLIDNTVNYLLYTKVWERALERVRTWCCLGGMDAPTMQRCIGYVDTDQMIALGATLVDLTRTAKRIRITSPAGTDVTGIMDGRKVEQTGGKYQMPQQGPMKYVFPGGQVSWCPVEETIRGTLVFDAFVWPPDEIGSLPRTPIRCHVKDGVITSITGGPDARTFQHWLASYRDPNMYRIAHWSYSYNPGARLTPTSAVIEAERVLGLVHFGVGSQAKPVGGKGWRAPAHADGGVLAPSVFLDGTAIEKDGRYVHPKLVKLCRQMGLRGY